MASIAFGPKGEGGLDDATGAGGAGGAGYQQVRVVEFVSDVTLVGAHVAAAAFSHRSRFRPHKFQTSKTVNLIKNEEEKKTEGIWGIKVRLSLPFVQTPARPVATVVPRIPRHANESLFLPCTPARVPLDEEKGLVGSHLTFTKRVWWSTRVAGGASSAHSHASS